MNDDILKTTEIPEGEQEKMKEKIIDLDADKLKFYEDLRKKAKGWTQNKGGSIGGKLGEYLFMLPDFFILVCRLAIDKRVSSKQKMIVGGIIAYVIMPIDIIPDFIPIVGQIDDLVLVVLGLNLVLNEIDPKVLSDNWSGEGEVLDQMKKITSAAERFLDKNLLQRIKGFLKHKI